jgi:hypothetical protein
LVAHLAIAFRQKILHIEQAFCPFVGNSPQKAVVMILNEFLMLPLASLTNSKNSLKVSHYSKPPL